MISLSRKYTSTLRTWTPILNIRNKDLNLLLLFHVLYQEQSVSAAAERMALSQPAISHRLNKLRDELGDELFVRVSRGLTPTPRAHELAPIVSNLLAGIRGFYDQCEGDNFLNRSDRFQIFSTDYIESLLLPKLIPIIREQAPKVQLVTRNLQGPLPKAEMERGQCDLAIAGYFGEIPDGFYQQTLYQDEFVVLACKDNPFTKGSLTLENYLACDHLMITFSGDLSSSIDQKLAAMNQTRKVIAGLTSFHSPALVIPGTQTLLTCLRSVAEQAIRINPDLEHHPCPLELETVHMQQVWHQRSHEDPLRRWLREQISQLLVTETGPA